MSIHFDAIPISFSRIALARTSDLLKLTKPGLTSLVLFTTLMGFCAATREPLHLQLLFHTLFGTALTAGSAAAFNMYAERKLDALMKRTALRPLAAGRLKSGQALIFALIAALSGFLYLFVFVNPLTSLLSAIVFASYLWLYTPLKTKTWLCTPAGAVPGALPIVMGWTGARGDFSVGAWVLFAIVFVWQLPHFYSIGWMHREDYARAGLPMLSVIDASGQKTRRQTLLSIAVLTIVSLAPVYTGLAGYAFFGEALVLGFAFFIYGIHFARSRDKHSARRLFIASAIYLPALLILLVLNKPGV
jgi:heme o synthase